MKHLRMIGLARFFLLLSFSASGPSIALAEKPQDLRAKVDLALTRLGFGARPGEIDEIVKAGEKGLDTWIQQQLVPEKIDDSVLEQLLARREMLSMSIEELMSRYDDKSKPDKRPDEIRKAWSSAKLIRAALSRRQFQERLVDFWYNHFNVDQRKGKDRWYFGPYERDAIRPHLFGSFYELLRATARHPAMLMYLDNFLSQVAGGKKNQNKGLNENYGRELLELHTLGVGAEYTQTDVKEAARVLTGWSIADQNTSPTFLFKQKLHDSEEKKILNWHFESGGDEAEGERLLKLLATHPATARHIATQLAEEFVASPPPRSLVEKLTKRFLETAGDLRAVYRELISASEFWELKNRGTLLKDHFIWTISAVRALGGEVIWKNQLTGELARLGEPLYQCAPPTGFRKRADDFVNAGSLIARLAFALRLAANRVEGVYLSPPNALAAKLHTDNDLIQFLANSIGLATVSDSTRAALKEELVGEPWRLGTQEPRPFILSRLLGILIASPEFQRM